MIVIILLVGLFCGASSCLGAVQIVQGGQSRYVIVVPENAPDSVGQAAEELQLDVQLAGGAKLPIQKDRQAPAGPFISLGATRQARAAGFSVDSMPQEAYRIVSREGNLYIFGPDTPDDGWTAKGGVSNGTANGVYTFLEDRMGVRWLMPGDLGRVVPRAADLRIDDLDVSGAPYFELRSMMQFAESYANDPQRRIIRRWNAHLRAGRENSGTLINFKHNWLRTMNDGKSQSAHTPAVRKLFKEHPDWFAMDKSGKRKMPQGRDAKFETTNPEVVRWYAQQAIKHLKASPRPETYSLSPTDGRGWSESPETLALRAKSKEHGPRHDLSTLVFTWYHDVASIVQKEYPQGRLSGYIYDGYINPPANPELAKMPSNFTPVIAMSMDYGWKLFTQSSRDQFKSIMGAWAKIIPGDWYYYDLPNTSVVYAYGEIGKGNFPGTSGLVTPGAPEILNFVFPQLLKHHIKGTIIYGSASWSNAALANYLIAKMEWNPHLDAKAVQRDWLHHAYGPEAGAVMETFYDKLEGYFRDCYQKGLGTSYKMSLPMMRFIYSPEHYHQLESLLLQAQALTHTAPQKERLKLITDNMIVLQWRLRSAGYLPADFSSQLRRDDRQVLAVLNQQNPAFPLFPGITVQKPTRQPKNYPWSKVQWAPAAEASATAENEELGRMDADTFVLFSTSDRPIRIDVKQVKQGPFIASYEVRDGKGEVVQSSVLIPDAPIVIPAKAGEVHYLYIPDRNMTRYTLSVAGGAIAQGHMNGRTLTLSGASAPVHLFHAGAKSTASLLSGKDEVVIRKPSSDASAKAAMRRGDKYRDVHVLHSFDDGWRFSPDPKNDGIARGVLKANFDDSQWKTLSALSQWTMQGTDYHGPAWYRRAFTLPKPPAGQVVRLYFGAVDGNAVVYLNGKKVGAHHLGEDFKGWDRPFFINVTDAIQAGSNLLAVQVTSKDATSASGMFNGVCLLTAHKR